MAFAPGTRLGGYEILSLIGQGGMGEVYRATDTKLHRAVAVKVLPGEVAADADRLARFEREAQVLASLNHPNVAHIYGVEDSTGTPALVMELVEGPTLADRIAKGPIPLDEALPIAKQIAEALEAAHEQGIIHRDLKPANIKVRPDGTVKVLDFGLAKAFEPAGVTAGSATMSPTLSIHATQAGTILGTAAYMSPEQARGGQVDRRADLWAFGCVLYEMLTGRRAFNGDTISDTLASVLKTDVDWTALPAQIAPAVQRLLVLCLRKDAKLRLRDIGDARLLLDLSAATPAELVSVPKSRVASRLPWAAAALFGIAAGWLAVNRSPSAIGSRSVRFQVPPPAQNTYSPAFFALSPDARRLAFVAFGQDRHTYLWVRDIDALEPRRLIQTEGATSPFWSPDGRRLGFYDPSDTGLKWIDPAGGARQLITGQGANRGQSWGPRGVVLFGGNVIYKVSADRGDPVPVTALDAARRELFHARPFFLPDGKHFLYVRASDVPENSGIYVGSLDAAPDAQAGNRLMGGLLGAAYANGHIYFLRDSQLISQRFDPDRLEMSGQPEVLATDVGDNGNASGYFSVAATGALAYRQGIEDSQLTWYDPQGKSAEAVGAASRTIGLRASPNGNSIATVRYGPNASLWIFDASRGAASRFTSNAGWNSSPVWSPDSQLIVFSSRREGPADLYLKLASGAQPERLLLHTGKPLQPFDWSPDGRHLLYGEADDLWVLEGPEGAQPKATPFLRTAFHKAQATFSPDGRFVAYTSDESRRDEVYVRPFPIAPGNARWTVSVDGGSQSRWSRDGKQLFFVSRAGVLTVVDVKLGATFQASAPQALFALPPFPANGAGNWHWDQGSDGRFVVSVPVNDFGKSSISVVLP